MGRFIDAADLYARHGGDRVRGLAAQVNGTAGVADVVTNAIAAAEGLALSYLLPRYRDQDGADNLPATSGETPSILQQQVCDVALRELVRSFPHVDQQIQLGYDAAVSWLRAVQAGRADLGITSSGPAVDRSAPALLAELDETDMVFGNGGLDGW